MDNDKIYLFKQMFWEVMGIIFITISKMTIGQIEFCNCIGWIVMQVFDQLGVRHAT